MTTDHQKGAIAETAIAAAAVRLGIGVSRPIGGVERYDLIFDLHPRLVRVQCKWGVRDGEVIIVRCLSSRRSGVGHVRRAYTAQECDALAAYCAELGSCYFLPIGAFSGRTAIQLRLAPARNNQALRVNWAADFAFEALDWSEFRGP